jgi:hypothetical protein
VSAGLLQGTHGQQYRTRDGNRREHRYCELGGASWKQEFEERRFVAEPPEEWPERAVSAAEEDEHALSAECRKRDERHDVCLATPRSEIDGRDTGQKEERDQAVGRARRKNDP